MKMSGEVEIEWMPGSAMGWVRARTYMNILRGGSGAQGQKSCLP